MVAASVRDDRCTSVSLASERSVVGALNRSSSRDAIMEDWSDCYFNRNPSTVFDLFLLALRLWFEGGRGKGGTGCGRGGFVLIGGIGAGSWGGFLGGGEGTSQNNNTTQQNTKGYSESGTSRTHSDSSH